MRKNVYMVMMIAGMTLAVTACGTKQTGSTETSAPVQMESTVETSTEERVADSEKETTKPEETEKGSSLDQMASMIGMSDEDAKTLLGEGTENWSPDHSILIGRIYNTELFGKKAVINTMYDEDNLVSMVQAELSDMSVSESEKQITEATGVDMENVDAGEGGQGSSQWIWNELMINLYQNEGGSIIELFVPVL